VLSPETDVLTARAIRWGVWLNGCESRPDPFVPEEAMGETGGLALPIITLIHKTKLA
jgi:hypothetical protein